MEPFSPRETALITFCTAIVVGILVNWLRGRSNVSCDHCERVHAALDEELEGIRKKDSADHGMMLRMLRSIVCHLPLDADKKEAILNDNGGHK